MHIFAGVNEYGYRFTSCVSVDSGHRGCLWLLSCLYHGSIWRLHAWKIKSSETAVCLSPSCFLIISSAFIGHNWAVTSGVVEWWIISSFANCKSWCSFNNISFLLLLLLHFDSLQHFNRLFVVWKSLYNERSHVCSLWQAAQAINSHVSLSQTPNCSLVCLKSLWATASAKRHES